jgi:hypothetical protein
MREQLFTHGSGYQGLKGAENAFMGNFVYNSEIDLPS